MSTGPWNGQDISENNIVELLEEEPLSLDPGLQYDVEGMVLPENIENSPSENKYNWLKWHLNEEAVLFRRELWDAEAMLDLILFQQTLEDWHKKKDQIIHAINLVNDGDYRGNELEYLMNVKVPKIPNPPGTTTHQQNSTQGHDHYFEAFLNNTLHLHDGWPIPDPSPAQNN